LNLVIVESPGKIKKLQSILGADYKVAASFGHVCDLPSKDLGYQESTLEETYVISPDKKKTIASLKRLAAGVQRVYLATDLDREGEAIAWHLIRELKLKSYYRIVFNEITEKAINYAINNPINLDVPKVEAQRTRRVLDRMFGYKVSPIVNNAIESKQYLSAGRVQSVALRLIVEKEILIRDFVSENHFGITAIFHDQKENISWKAKWNHEEYLQKLEDAEVKGVGVISTEDILEYSKDTSEKKIFKFKDKAQALVEFINAKQSFTIEDVNDTKEAVKAKECFKTSTLQQAASIAFKWSVDKTMKVAQKLYENGLITYMRTDSVVLSDDAISDVRHFLRLWQSKTGQDGYLPESPVIYKNKSKDAQEAHEAIRPSKIGELGKSIEDKDEKELYLLIWRRVVSSQMNPAIYDCRKITLKTENEFDGVRQEFKAVGKTIVFAGWKKVAGEDMTDEQAIEKKENNEKSDDQQSLPQLREGELVTAVKGDLDTKKTQPSPRFSEASLIARLEAQGIGRPATYASIVKTLLYRKYVAIEKRRFLATDLGQLLCGKMTDKFQFMEIAFTRDIEKKIDGIVSGDDSRVSLLSSQQKILNSEIEIFSKNNPAVPSKVNAVVETEYTCPKCSANKLLLRTKRNSEEKFFSCSGYPKCKSSYSVNSNGEPSIDGDGVDFSQHTCPHCNQSKLESRKGKFGAYFHCHNEKCNKNIKSKSGKPVGPAESPVVTDTLCPKCSKGNLVKRTSGAAKNGKSSIFYGCSTYPACKHTQETN
jgi:DNA topoisomerase-1